MIDLQLSSKQQEYGREAKARWNFKIGAVRSGKTYADVVMVIPERIIERADETGLNVIMGVSRDTIERNILQPMREIYGSNRVSSINSRNIATLFGQDVYCLGAEKINQVAKIQGASIKYCYGDEVTKWNKEVFEMLKSRLDKPCSCFDGSCNPENPTHFIKEFTETAPDIYIQQYTIFDNPYLDKTFVDNLCTEYADSIYYDRYILGLWKRAEGAIYRKYADKPADFAADIKIKDAPLQGKRVFAKDKELEQINIGIDFGGNQSGHAFVAVGIMEDYQGIVALMSDRVTAGEYPQGIDAAALDKLIVQFTGEVIKRYGRVDYVYWDNAETVLGETITNAIGAAYPEIIVRPAKKKRIKDRIDTTVRLMGAERFFITPECETLSTALQDAVFNQKAETDERLDDGSTDIDSLDAFEYTFERDMKYLIED